MYLTTLLLLTLQLLNQASCDEAQDYYNQLYPCDSPRKGLPFAELARHDNYRCDTHYVTTCDGYILTIFHIYPNENCSIVHATHILFMHGLYLSSDDCIIPGPGKANCYMCADNGHHIWAGNNRGNKYARNHTTLNPDCDKEFWNFTFDDMAVCDMPAIIDYILKVSGQPKLNHIGHSQGFTVILMCCSLLPEYNAKALYAVGMSAATWLEHTRILALYVPELLANYNNYTICYETITVAISLQPSGTSVENFPRWDQMMKYPFCSYDYGPQGHLFVYGSLYPPVMNVSKYRVPTQFNASYNVYISDPRDCKTCITSLTGYTNCISVYVCVISAVFLSYRLYLLR